MKTLISLGIAMFLIALGAPARADGWDHKGWVKLGDRELMGKVDHDHIDVGKYEGRFSKLTMYVEKNDIELEDFEVTFGNGEHWNASTKHQFHDGARTREIDLPGDERIIKSINIKYKNFGAGRARIEVWGLKDEGHGMGGGMHGPVPFSWDSNGWVMLGEREVRGHGKDEKDTIEVGRHEGHFHKLTIVVTDSDLEMVDFKIEFGNGEPWHPGLSHFFKDGQRTHVIEFPLGERTIKFVRFNYRNIPGEGHAKVQVWAK